MFIKLYSFILLLAIICLAIADIDSNVDIVVKSEVRNVSEDVFHLGRTCASDEDCHHLGKCIVKARGKFCNCKKGTGGDFCEKVDECVDNPVKCGTLDDVSCAFDIEEEIAVCKCDNTSKTYVEDEKRCMSPCLNFDDCGQYGSCDHKIGNKKFCTCDLGISGDYCDIIDACHKKTVDCGVDNNATCSFGLFGKAYCECDDTTKGFDYDNKICKDCSGCGGEKVSSGTCSFRAGNRICACRLRYYSNEKGKCEDCKCGQDSYGCKFENGTKTCWCWARSSNNDGLCQKCDCGLGLGVSKCEFKNGKKFCTCKKGYTVVDGSCKQCDCGDHGKCSLSIRGLKVCTCNEGYVEDNGLCKECNCGKNGKCLIDYNGKKKCICSSGYKEYQGTCKGCYCQSYAECEFDKFGDPKCTCLPGYGLKNKDCTPCNCYPGTSCTFIDSSYYRENKVCICPKGYADDNGNCRDCDCQAKGSNCTYSLSFMRCQCPKGYSEEDKPYSFLRKICKDIDECRNSYACPPSSTKCVNTPGSYKCECKNGYEGPQSSDDIKRLGCKDIDECVRLSKPCNDADARCINTPGSYRCECQSGYYLKSSEEKRNICGSVRPWRTATIVVGLASATIIIGLIIAVFKRCSS